MDVRTEPSVVDTTQQPTGALMPAPGRSLSSVRRAADALIPQTLDAAMKLADMLAGSDIVPREFRGKPGNVLVAMQMGLEVGLHPMQAIQSIAVINGRPCIWGDAVLGIVMASEVFAGIEETLTHDGKDPNQVYATCTVRRRGKDGPLVVTRTFSWADAMRAGLHTKDTYRTYPQRMLQHRARAWALRDAFPDVLKGLQIREEVEDYRQPDPGTANGAAEAHDNLMPRRKGEPEAPAAPGSAHEAPPAAEVIAPATPGSGPTDEEALAATAGVELPTVAASEVVPPVAPDDNGQAALLLVSAAPDEAAERAALLEEIEQLIGDTKVKAQYFAARWDHHTKGAARNTAPVAGLRALRDELKRLLPTAGSAPAPAAPGAREVFTIGSKTYETAGITKDQLLAAFQLGGAVNKKAGSDLAHVVLRKEFGVASRTELTAEAASKYLVRLREIAEN